MGKMQCGVFGHMTKKTLKDSFASVKHRSRLNLTKTMFRSTINPKDKTAVFANTLSFKTFCVLQFFVIGRECIDWISVESFLFLRWTDAQYTTSRGLLAEHGKIVSTNHFVICVGHATCADFPLKLEETRVAGDAEFELSVHQKKCFEGSVPHLVLMLKSCFILIVTRLLSKEMTVQISLNVFVKNREVPNVGSNTTKSTSIFHCEVQCKDRIHVFVNCC